MAKSNDIDRNGKLTRAYMHKIFLQRDINETASKLYGQKRNREMKMGIRSITMEAYFKGGRDAALKAIEEANKRMGDEIYTSEILDTWIAEELEKRSRDDDNAR